MSTTLQVILGDDQLEELAERIYRKIAKAQTCNKPLTVAEAATALNISYDTANRRIAAGIIRTVPGIGCRRVSQSEIRRILGESAD